MCLLTPGVGKLINGSTEKQTVSSGQKPTLKKRVLAREWAPTGNHGGGSGHTGQLVSCIIKLT